ncbi:MAG: hypothetical protein JSS49_14280 [Planctomycetes bacterium]|nr:hypothetical protein [Planctomycetota bacterium]
MAGPNWSYLMAQLNNHGPVFLVYTVAFVVALVNLGRMWLPAILTIAGVGILAVTTIVLIAAQQYLINSRPTEWQYWLGLLGLLGSCLRALGMGLLVAAVFVGRNPISPSRYLDEA